MRPFKTGKGRGQQVGSAGTVSVEKIKTELSTKPKTQDEKARPMSGQSTPKPSETQKNDFVGSVVNHPGLEKNLKTKPMKLELPRKLQQKFKNTMKRFLRYREEHKLEYQKYPITVDMINKKLVEFLKEEQDAEVIIQNTYGLTIEEFVGRNTSHLRDGEDKEPDEKHKARRKSAPIKNEVEKEQPVPSTSSQAKLTEDNQNVTDMLKKQKDAAVAIQNTYGMNIEEFVLAKSMEMREDEDEKEEAGQMSGRKSAPILEEPEKEEPVPSTSGYIRKINYFWSSGSDVSD